MDKAGRRWIIPLLLVLAVVCSAGIFQWQFRYDNKYTAWRPDGQNGIMWLDSRAAWEDPGLLLHLVDGWEVYRDKLLEPAEIADHIPDRYLFLGQYDNLRFGDEAESGYGDATYRTSLYTDGVTRTYALEVPEIYSAYRLWVNGVELSRKGGLGADYRPEIDGTYLVFEAGECIEIVVQVSDHHGYYSGMVYPPAFGTPDAVQRVLTGRMLAHGFAWAIALLLGVFCLLPWQGWRAGGRRQVLLALFCLFFVLYTGYPLTHGWGLTGNLWYGVERLSRQMMTVCLLLLTGELCGVPRRIVFPAACAGALVALLMLQPQLLPGWDMGGAQMVGSLLRWWHRIASLLLVGFGAWGLWKRRVASAGLLAGALIFSCATVMDQIHSIYEPVITGFFAETAGFLILLILAGVMRWEAWEHQKERAGLRELRELLEARIDFQVQAAQAERAYTQQVHTMRHDMQGHLTLLSGYLKGGKHGEADGYLDELLDQNRAADVQAVTYCGHPLIDDVLTAKLAQAKRMGARVTWRIDDIDSSLPIRDHDLMRVLLNLLDNALEALERVEQADRELTLRLLYQGGVLKISCANACAVLPDIQDGRLLSTKNGRGHGLGLSLVREVAEKYNGTMEVSPEQAVFKVSVLLNLNQHA